ncbi:YbaB/EbfC family nucleoid-associated protein [Planomonospora sp. ID82291]|uniref:YbaB/EbfC family nucleoid-associated protein n=1 Tax=Planomonospora sp. ID82291 TaxID=2738136 RepID=UPI0018C39809|nr:YbaB/EbfC family nucleoid-associated protein [Planomonospora sp. ID82291]MBG0816641.1 YbaB/EbfC family nucleoid-associated protein [Planomonospora sp. ID82291]
MGDGVQPVGEPDVAGMQAYADELRRTFARLQDDGLDRLRDAKTVQVTEKSQDGLVAATVGPRGELIRLDIDPRIYRRPDARALADVITGTVHRAAESAQRRVVEIFEPLIPAEQMRAYLDGDAEAAMARLADQMAGREIGHL